MIEWLVAQEALRELECVYCEVTFSTRQPEAVCVRCKLTVQPQLDLPCGHNVVQEPCPVCRAKGMV